MDENGEYQGYDIYFANRLGEDLGAEVNFVSTEAANRIEYLQTGKVDVILASLTYTAVGGGYQFSIRSCDNTIPANQLAAYICEEIGSGGGHTKKAGGRISARSFREKYGEADIFDVLNRRMKEFIRPAIP